MRSGFCATFGRPFGQEPTRQAARKTARNAGGAGSGNRKSICRTWRRFFTDCRLGAGLLFDNGSCSRRSYGLVAILCERFARKKNLLGDIGRRRARTARAFLTAVVVAALLAAITIVVAAAKLAALRRSILGRRKISPAWTALLAAAPMTAPAPAAPTSAATAIAAAAVVLALPVIATIVAAFRSTVIAGTPRVVLSWIEMRRKVLRRGSVRLRLALFSRFHMRAFGANELFAGSLFLRLGNLLARGSRSFFRRGRFLFCIVLRMKLYRARVLTPLRRAGQRFPRKQLDGGTVARRNGWRGR